MKLTFNWVWNKMCMMYIGRCLRQKKQENRNNQNKQNKIKGKLVTTFRKVFETL